MHTVLNNRLTAIILFMIAMPLISYSQAKKEIKQQSIKAKIIMKSVKDNPEKMYRAEEIIYNQNGDESEISTFEENGTLKQKEIFMYNQEGKLMEEKRINSKGQQSKKRTYNYNEKGEKTGYTEFDTNGKIKETRVIDYDNKSTKIKRTDRDAKGALIYQEKYEYRY